MANVTDSSRFSFIVDNYKYFMDTKSDPRTINWLLIGSPGPLLTILATYLYFCVSAGPKYMKDRKPYELKNVLLIYNIVQVAASIFLVNEGLKGGWGGYYDFACQPIDWSNDVTAVRMAGACWWYFFFKITELLDTVFFVLRKKKEQISFLHLYHHTMMPVCGWIGVRFLPGGHGTLLGLVNSFIHVIMYTYYLLSGLGSKYQKYLWWKKHLTAMQMIQFCIIFVHSFQVLFRSCEYPKIISFLLSLQALYFLYLFGKFYVTRYNIARKEKLKAEAENNNLNNMKNGVAKVKSS